MTIILPTVPPPSLPKQQSAVLVSILPLQRIVYLYPQWLPYGRLHTISPMAILLLSTSTSFSGGVPIRPSLSYPWLPPCAPHSCPLVSQLPASPVCAACCLRQVVVRGRCGLRVFVRCSILYSKTIATIRPRIIAYTTKSFYNNWLELNLVVLQVYLYYIRHRDDALYVSWQHRVIFAVLL